MRCPSWAAQTSANFIVKHPSISVKVTRDYRGSIVEEGWVLVTRSGSTGVVSTVPEAWAGSAFSEHVIRIVPKKELLHPAWIQVFCGAKQANVPSLAGFFGSVIDEITPEHIGNMEIPIPTDNRIYETLVKEVVQVEEKRQSAIHGLNHAVHTMNELFSLGDSE